MFNWGTKELIWCSSRSWCFLVPHSKNLCSACVAQGQTDPLHWLVTKKKILVSFYLKLKIELHDMGGCVFFICLWFFSPQCRDGLSGQSCEVSACSSAMKWSADLKVWGEMIYRMASSWILFNLEKNFCLPVMHLFRFPKLTATLIECVIWCYRNAVQEKRDLINDY